MKNKSLQRIWMLRATHKKKLGEKELLKRLKPSNNLTLERKLEALYEEIAPQLPVEKLKKYLVDVMKKIRDPKRRQKLINNLSKLSDQEDNIITDNNIPAKPNKQDPAHTKWFSLKVLSLLDLLPLKERPLFILFSALERNV